MLLHKFSCKGIGPCTVAVRDSESTIMPFMEDRSIVRPPSAKNRARCTVQPSSFKSAAPGYTNVCRLDYRKWTCCIEPTMDPVGLLQEHVTPMKGSRMQIMLID